MPPFFSQGHSLRGPRHDLRPCTFTRGPSHTLGDYKSCFLSCHNRFPRIFRNLCIFCFIHRFSGKMNLERNSEQMKSGKFKNLTKRLLPLTDEIRMPPKLRPSRAHPSELLTFSRLLQYVLALMPNLRGGCFRIMGSLYLSIVDFSIAFLWHLYSSGGGVIHHRRRLGLSRIENQYPVSFSF